MNAELVIGWSKWLTCVLWFSLLGVYSFCVVVVVLDVLGTLLRTLLRSTYRALVFHIRVRLWFPGAVACMFCAACSQ